MLVLRLLGHLWSLPNTIIGSLLGIGGAFRWDKANRVFFVRGGWTARFLDRRGYAGMCVGDVVIALHHLPTRSPSIYRHECVHATQARLLGLLYLPATFVGYAYGFLRFRPNPHDASPLEIWADVASGCAESNAYLRARRSRSY